MSDELVYHDEEGNERTFVHRRTTPSERVAFWGGVLAILGMVFAGAGTVSGWIPTLLNVARADEVQELRKEFDEFRGATEENHSELKSEVAQIRRSQAETLELQLLSRLDAINDQLSTAVEPVRISSLRQTRNELVQRIENARAEIELYRGVE